MYTCDTVSELHDFTVSCIGFKGRAVGNAFLEFLEHLIRHIKKGANIFGPVHYLRGT